MKLKTNIIGKPLAKPCRFKIVSKFKNGQKIYALNEGKIIQGVISGYKHSIISDRNYISNFNEYEISTGFDIYVWAKESDCYTSQRTLISAIKK